MSIPLAILVSLATGLVVAGLLYRKRPPGKGMWPLLLALRALLIAGVVLLLFNPTWPVTEVKTLYPRLYVAMDRSESMSMGPDGPVLEEKANRAKMALEQALEGVAEVVPLHFTDEVEKGWGTGFAGAQTKLDAPISWLKTGTDQRLLAGLVLITDGISTRGSGAGQLQPNFPLYMLWQGDTLPKPDVALQSVITNPVAIAGKSIPMEISIAANDLTSPSIDVAVKDAAGNVLYAERWTLPTGKGRVVRRQISLPPLAVGTYPLEVQVEPLAEEQNTSNNKAYVSIVVEPFRKRVVLVYEAPHPDVALFKDAIAEMQSVEIEVVSVKELQEALRPNDLLLAIGQSSEAFVSKGLNNHPGPQCWVLGGASFFELSLWEGAFAWSSSMRTTEFIYPEWQASSPLSWEAPSGWNPPPVSGKAGQITKGGARPAAFVRVGNLVSEAPFMAVIQYPHHGVVIPAGGFWRWKLHEGLKPEWKGTSHQLIQAIIRHLEAEATAEVLRLQVAPQFSVGEAIQGDVILTKPGGGPWLGEKVELVLEGGGTRQEQVLTQQQAVQPFQWKAVPAGVYALKAKTQVEQGGKPFAAEAVVRVEDWNAEAQNLYTDPAVLRRVSSLSGGRAVPLDAAEDLAKSLADTMPPAIRQSFTRYQNLRSAWWYFLILVILASTEWLLRRLGGKL